MAIMSRDSLANYLSLVVTCGAMLVGITWFIIGHIDAVAAADRDALMQQTQIFQNEFSAMDTRVTRIETNEGFDSKSIDKLTAVIDALQQSEGNLAQAVSKLSAIEDARNGGGHK